MISTIIFDAGGVFFRGSFLRFVEKSCMYLGCENPLCSTQEVVFDPDFNRGLIDASACFSRFFGMTLRPDQLEALQRYWKTTWILDQRMVDIAHHLRESYTLALFSNSDPVNSPQYQERGWYDVFDTLVLSHEEHMLKPEKEFYELLLERLAVPAATCVFVDDQASVLVPARKLGMATIHFKNADQMVSAMREIGIRI